MPRENSRGRSISNWKKSVLALAAMAAAPSVIHPQSASASTFTWDNNGATAPFGQDGAGTWDTTLQNFTDGASNFAWNNANNDVALFGNTANGGSITFAAGIIANGVVIDRNSYQLFGTGANNLTLAGDNPFISLQSPATSTTLNVPITSTGTITFSMAPGTTINLSGNANITATGYLLTGGGTLNVGKLSTSSTPGGTLSNNAGTLSNGTLALGDSRTVSNAFFVADSTNNGIVGTGNSTYSGSLTGTGVIDMISTGGISAGSAGSFLSVGNSEANFQGTIRTTYAAASPGNGIIRWTTTPNAVGTTLDIGSFGRITTNVTNSTMRFGAITGGDINSATVGLYGGNSADGLTTYEVGTLNTNTVFNGFLRDGGNATLTNVSNTRHLALTKVGSGNLTLANLTSTAANYTGATIINGGTLAITNPAPFRNTPSIAVNVGTFANPGAMDFSAVSGGYTINAGQTLQGTGGTVYGTVNVTNPTGIVNPGVNGASPVGGTLTFHDTLNLNGGTVQFDLSNSTSSNDDLLNVNALSLTAPSKLYLSPIGGFTTGTYRLINYTSLPGGTASLSNLSIASAASITAQLDTSTPGQINLNVLSLAAAANIRWNGPGSVWDVGSTQNFFNTDTSAAAAFFEGDNVTFDDNASVTTLTVSGSAQPSLLHFNNTNNNYTLGSAAGGAIAGSTGIVKDGTGSVALNMANPYSGGTTINFGTLRTNNSGGFGNGSIMLNGGTLGIDGAIGLANQIYINANATLSGNGSFSAIQSLGNTVNLDIASGNTISMGSVVFAGDPVTGTFSMGTSNGTFRFTDTVAIQASLVMDLGTGSGVMFSRDGNGHSITLAGIAGGPNTKIFGPGSTNTNMTYVVGLAPSPFGTVPSQTTFAGQLNNGTAGSSSTVSLAKNGPNYRLIMSGNNSYTGTTSINAGTLEVDGTHTGGGIYSVDSGATLSGTGVIGARIDQGPDGYGVIQPGSVANPAGALSVATLNMNNANLAFTIGNGAASKLNVTGSNGILSGTANVSITDVGGSTYGRYTLVDYNGTPLADLSQFNPNSGFNIGTLSGNLVNNTFNTSVDLYLANPSAHDSTWSGATSNQWQTGVTGNWTNGLVPGVADDFATFTDTGSGSVVLPAPETVAQIVFNTSSAAAYNLSGAQLTLDASGGYVNINTLGGTQTISASLAINKPAFLGVDTPASLVLSGQVSGSNAIVKSGAGTLVLSGNNTFSGPVTLNTGTIVASSGTSIGDGSSTNTLALNGGTLVVNGTFNSPATRTIQLQASSTIIHGDNNMEIDGVISGAKLTLDGAGSVLFTGANTFNGGLTILNGGTVQSTTATGAGSGRWTLSANSTLIVPGSQTYGNAITLNGTATLGFTSESQGTFSGVVTDNGNHWFLMPGIPSPLTVNFTTNTVSGNPTGTVTIGNSGTLRLIGTSGAFNMGSLTVDVGTSGGVLMNRDGGLGSVQLGGITGDTTTTLRGAGSSAGTTNYHIGYNNVDNLFSGTVSNGTSGNLALTKEGTASLTLPGTLTYTGGTTVTSGGLKVNKLAPGSVAVNAGSLQVMAKANANDITGTSVITSLSIASGASVDVTNNSTIIDYSTLTTQLNDLRTEINAGSLTSSTAAGGLVLGYADASAVGRSSFGGVTLADNTAIVIGLTNRGDANMDGVVNALDFNALATNFGTTTNGIWQQGDFNYDQQVNTLDFTALAQNFNKSVVLPAPALGSLVPEPASLGALAMLGLLGRRRKRD